jgi:hypothetical protein
MDLIERLRMTGAPNYQSPICVEAADELERVYQADRLKTSELNILVRENRALRAALELAVPALELGLPAMRTEAANYHAAMTGRHRHSEHSRLDADCETVAAALSSAREVLGSNVI